MAAIVLPAPTSGEFEGTERSGLVRVVSVKRGFCPVRLPVPAEPPV